MHQVRGKQSHHRPHQPGRDGPNVLEGGQVSTRAREMEQLQSRHCRGSGLGPGHYNGAKGKDSCLRNSRTGGRIGSAVRGNTSAVLAYSPSISSILSQQYDAVEGICPDTQRMGALKKTDGLASPEGVGMFRPATPDEHRSQQAAPTAVACIAYTSKGTKSGLEVSADLKPLKAAEGKAAAPSKDAVYMAAKQQPYRKAPKKPPCPPQLLASASHCELPGDWDWNSLNRSAWKSFSAQAGGCHRNSRTTSQSKTAVCRRPPQDVSVDRYWEAPGVKSGEPLDRGDIEFEISATSMEPIPEEGRLATPPCGDRTGKHRQTAACTALVSESEIRSHELANSHAEEAKQVDIRKRRWELYSCLLYTSPSPRD